MTDAGWISLTFDDALEQHLDVAIPLLDAHALPGTFYVHLGATSLTRRMSDWTASARRGHELGNHTIFHPATETKSWVSPGNAIELYTLDRMRMELEVANQWLSAIDGETARSFAYPNSNPTVGRWGCVTRGLFAVGLRNTRWPGVVERSGLDFGNTRSSYRTLLPEQFIAARGGGLNLEDRPPPLDQVDRYALPSAAVDGHDLAAMRAFVERAVEGGTWAILQFHGVNGGHRMNCGGDAFRDLVHWLADAHAPRVTTIREGAARCWHAHAEPVRGGFDAD